MSTPRAVIAARSLQDAPQERRDARMGKAWVDVLHGVPLFQPLSKRHVRKIAEAGTEARFEPGTPIVRKGERGETFFVSLDGEARVHMGGKRRARLGMGDFFGEMALLDGGARSATVTAETQVHAMRISRRRFLQVVERDPKLALELLKVLAARLRASERSTSL